MSKLKKYTLQFVKRKLSNGTVYPNVLQETNGSNNSVLSFIEALDKHDCESFIYDLDRCIDGHTNVDEGFFSDSVEHMDILYEYPYVNIDDVLIIPMLDMKELLEEWLEFIK
ncbi:hypothetical protein [Pedobacter zeae]|uniref:Uncharacterized protein n=1 Tax=Pedobacter zeae TaxID=1737356 RepID=A0A7W6KB98_9SPHI|nr:hypothetical protein [Pedobacter zeae]MBB4108613.1 hypothetical protein [Pedobacter zeae]GGG91642.1 hypothetical protein GCM10007422_00720 [Pedobacter zeae]